MKRFSAAFIEIISSVKSKFDKKNEIYKNGVDNDYPELIESLIDNSVTASRCAALMASYISGKGFGDELNKIIVHDKKKISLLQLVQDIAESYSRHKGFFIQLNYDLNYNFSSIECLPFTDCRVGKEDDDKYKGKIAVCSDWQDAKEVKKAKLVDVYNDNKKVVETQINKAGSIHKYNGQIYYYHEGKKNYPLSPLHPCIEDSESEKLSAIYKSTSLKKGFFGKTLFITKPLVEADRYNEDEAKEYQDQVKERTNFREVIKQFIGAENADGVLHLEMEFDGEDIEKEILVKNIDSNINDKLFSYTENSVSDNIRMCFNNVPAPLIRSKEGALFGSSGDAINAMKLFYQDQTNDERMIVEQTIQMLLSRFANKPNQEIKLIPLIDVNQQANNS
ncbi:hypothetical protein INR75_06625 [Zunongwangia sp. SCSIO 43204]|uniref:hypothetical protein n=1 Tax=Zunongwangia sp. SCSIO 43204 TaxID=2779359 RepID=UPI001CA945A2|nr:hypothetical protein [Zunongwangia sp. SCSIO 43204]UAB85683.1 hypothetical protein INR75_06625 [Zunongwangia sp. SCSIO 43204]